MLVEDVTSSCAGSTPAGLGWAWFDRRRNDLLRDTGCVADHVVQHSMRPQDAPTGTLAELDDEAGRWPSPWREAIRACVRRRGVTGTTSRANASVVARPFPFAAPVTNATLPVKLPPAVLSIVGSFRVELTQRGVCAARAAAFRGGAARQGLRRVLMARRSSIARYPSAA